MNQRQPETAVDYFAQAAATFGDNYAQQVDFQERLAVWGKLLDTYAQPGHLAVDLGCGTGIFALYLAQKGLQVVGVDGASTMVAQCERQRQEMGLTNARFMQAELPAFPETKLMGQANLVISSSVLEYVPQFPESLALCHQLLQPGGHLILSLPNAYSLNRLYQRLRFRLTGQPEVYAYIRNYATVNGLARRIRPYRLTLRECHHYGHRARLARISRQLHFPPPLAADLFVAVFQQS